MTLALDEDQAREIARLRERTPGTRCAVIGAVAIGHHVVLPRKTRDADLVIELGGEELTELLTGLAWKRDPRHQQRWTRGRKLHRRRLARHSPTPCGWEAGAGWSAQRDEFHGLRHLVRACR